MPVPSEFAVNTSTPPILKVLPAARFKFSLLVQEVLVLYQLNVLSVVPFNVMPPPSATISLVLEFAKIIFLSVTRKSLDCIVVLVPNTVKVPRINVSPFTSSVVAGTSWNIPILFNVLTRDIAVPVPLTPLL